MLLETIINGANSPKLVIIQETAEIRANAILFNFLKNESIRPRSDLLHIISFQNAPMFVKSDSISNAIFHDGYTDFLGWHADLKLSTRPLSNVKQINLKTHLVDHITKTSLEHAKNPDVKIMVIIDGLSILLRHKRTHDVCKLFNELSNLRNKVQTVQIVATVQRDVVSSIELNALTYIADASIILQSSETKAKRKHSGSQPEQNKFQADVTLRKKSGKVSREVVVCSVNKDLAIEKDKNAQVEKDKEEEASEADPTENLSFNLRLTETEKQARSQVKLPYMLNEVQKAVHLDGSTAGHGKIIYEPDDADDFDDEDPDDDLDI
eukprot:gene15199-16768_t